MLTEQEEHDLLMSLEVIWDRKYGNAVGRSFWAEYVARHAVEIIDEFYHEWNGGSYGVKDTA